MLVTTAATDFIQSIIDSIDSSDKSIGIFLDLRRAIDSISHKIILDRLLS